MRAAALLFQQGQHAFLFRDQGVDVGGFSVEENERFKFVEFPKYQAAVCMKFTNFFWRYSKLSSPVLVIEALRFLSKILMT